MEINLSIQLNKKLYLRNPEESDLGRRILADATPPDLADAHVSDNFDHLRWFELPRECYAG